MALVGNRDLIGRAVRDALPEIEGQAIYEALNAAFASGQPIIAKDTRLTFRPAGEEESIVRYADFVLQPILDESDHVSGIFVEGLDVTDRREAKIALEATQQRLHEGMVAARMSIWDWDLATGKVVFSDTSAEIFGGEWTDLKAVWKFIHPDDMACLNAEREKALAGADAYSTIVRMTPPGSKTIWMKISAKVMRDDAGVAVSIRGVTIDVTERKEAEERLREADRRKDEFLAMLAHELRNPLAPITAGAEILRLMPGDRDRVLRTGAVIERQARHMTAMVSDLLDVSRVTTGRVTLVLSVFDLHTAILESIEQTRSLLDARRQKLTYHAPSGAVSIEADKKRVIQVFTNIIQNAAKFTPERGSITVSLAAMGDQAIAVVEDDGMGIDAELLPRVFDLFTQEKRTSDRSLGGLGIGLSLVKSLVEQQGGLVSAASDGLNRGSTFTVALPLADASEELGYGDTSSTNDSLGAKALRVLVVDDNKDAAESMAILLGREGHAVTVCFHPLEALRLAMDKSGNFDAFVLDIGLPEMDGNELAKRLRAHSSTRNARLIAVTGYSDPKDKAIGLAAGFDHFLVKPVDAKVVFSALAVSGL
jgi:PAS domain S-box-containing protein